MLSLEITKQKLWLKIIMEFVEGKKGEEEKSSFKIGEKGTKKAISPQV